MAQENKPISKTQTFIKRALTTFTILYFTAFIGLNLGAKYLLNTSNTKKLLQDKSNEYLQKQLVLDPNITLKFSWSFAPTLGISNVNIENLMTAKELQISISLWPLLLKKIYIKKLSLQDFTLNIQSNKSLKSNPSNNTSEASNNSFNLMFDKIEFFNGNINLIQNSKSQNIAIKELTLYNNNMKFSGKADINISGEQCFVKLNTDLTDMDNINVNIEQLQYGNINLYGEIKLQSNPNSLTGELFSDKLIFTPQDKAKVNNSTTDKSKSSTQYQLPDILNKFIL
jgi:uncharacterized protein involved in outer membrane biogenesis